MRETFACDFGTRFSFPENMRVEYEGFSGSIINEVVVNMAEKYDSFIASQIAMEARREGISDLTVLNKPAILAALSKAVPKQVHISSSQCLCPRCQTDLMGLWDNPEAEDPKYCPICGQHLQWR